MSTDDTRCIIFAAPKFCGFAVDLSRELLQSRMIGKVAALCTGGKHVADHLRQGLGEAAALVDDIEREESKWLNREGTDHDHESIEEELGAGVVGEAITSDRRIGRGFVTGGRCRPDDLGDRAQREPVTIPERYVLGLYRYLDERLTLIQPRFVFAYAVAGAPAYLMARMCRARGIPFFLLVPARLGNRYLVDDDFRGLMNPVKRVLGDSTRQRVSAEQERYAMELLEEFRNKPESPEYSKRNDRLLKRQSVSRAILNSAVATGRILGHSLKTMEWKSVDLRRAWYKTELAFRRRFVSDRCFSEQPPADCEWIYFPLHVDPEASTMVVAPMHTNQLAVIEALAKALPAGMRLVVKEHRPMLGRRPKGFYSAIARMPRVVLTGPEREGVWWVNRSRATVTITGTAGWEAIRLGKPVVFVGNTPFTLLGNGVVQEPDISRLPVAIREAISGAGVDEARLQQFMAALVAVSFELPTSLLWGEYQTHGGETKRQVVAAVTKGIQARLEECE